MSSTEQPDLVGRGGVGASAAAGAGQPRPEEAVAALIASRRLIERRQQFLGFFRQRLSRPQDAEDALQDFCVKVIRAAEHIDDDARVDGWLGRVLHHTLVDHYRRRAARQRAEADYAREMQDMVGETGADDQDPCGCIDRALPGLRPDYAEILRRADLADEPREQIARALGLTVNNVGVRLHRARRALKRKLREVCPSCASVGCHSRN